MYWNDLCCWYVCANGTCLFSLVPPCSYIPVLYVFNKIDSLTIEELDILDQMPNYVPISSGKEWNLEELMETIWDRCNMLRIYTKPKGQIPDYEAPVILHAENPTIEEFCNRLHKGLLAQFSHAWVWGESVWHENGWPMIFDVMRSNTWHYLYLSFRPECKAPATTL